MQTLINTEINTIYRENTEVFTKSCIKSSENYYENEMNYIWWYD